MTHNLKPCLFSFDDGIEFEGFAYGSTWNGFDNVAVTPAVHAQVIEHFKEISGPFSVGEFEDVYGDMIEMQPDENGLISYGWGYCTTITTPEEIAERQSKCQHRDSGRANGCSLFQHGGT